MPKTSKIPGLSGTPLVPSSSFGQFFLTVRMKGSRGISLEAGPGGKNEQCHRRREAVVSVAATATALIQLPGRSSTPRSPLPLLCPDPCLSPARRTLGGPEPRSATLCPSLWKFFQGPLFLPQATDGNARNSPLPLPSPEGLTPWGPSLQVLEPSPPTPTPTSVVCRRTESGVSL